MPSGSVVIYKGARGDVVRLKGRDDQGRQTMETLGRISDGWTRKKATLELAKRLDQVEKGWRKPASLTFENAAELWRAEAEVEKNWRPSTITQYVSILNRLNDWFKGMNLAQIRPSDVTAYKVAKLETLSGASVSRDLSILHSVFAWAVVTERADRNPCEGVPHPRAAQRKGNALRPEEMQALLRAFTGEQDRLVFLFLILTGVRRSELKALRWRDVDLIENRVRIVDSKTESGSRSIALPATLAEELWQHRRSTSYRADDDRVFCHPERGTVYRYSTFAKALREAYKAAGMTFPEGMRPFHDLRVTSMTNDAIAGANPIALMTKAGHASMATTRRYLRLAGTVFPEEAAALEARVLGVSHSIGTADRTSEPSDRSTGSSTRLSEPELTSHESASLNQAENGRADRL